MPKATSEIQTKTKLDMGTKISLGFMLATGLVTIGIFAFAGLYTLIVNHFGQPGVINITNAPELPTINENINSINSNAATDLNFKTE